MEDIFKPQSLTIKALFGNQDALYQIPRYQRPYSWGDEQIEKLWEDLRESQMNNESNYFLGSIITAKPQETSNYLDVVDGQQRLTTLLILLCVCRDLYPDINQDLLDIDPFAIDSNIIKSSIRYNDRFERLRLKTHSNHESDFCDLVLKEGKSISNNKPLKKELKLEEAPIYKFKNTAAFFTEKIKELGAKETGLFINYLFNNVKLIRIDCQSVSFAIKLFQVLNDRGLDLSNSDLIKSYLIGRIHKKYNSEEELKKQKEDQFMDDWKYCENIAIDTEEDMNSLFTIYEYYLLGENPKRSLSDELEAVFKDKDANDVISDFKKFVSIYKTHIYNREDAIIFSFYYLRWGMYWRSILLTALHTNYSDYEELLIVLRRYYYINWIAGNTLTKIKQTSFNMIGWIKNLKSIVYIKGELEKGIKGETLKRAKDNLNYDIYQEPWSKPLLFMIEYTQEDNPTFYSMSDRNIQVEHIIPRGYLKNSEWNYIKAYEGINNWINTGANLTLLSGIKNLAAKNDGLSKKIKAYDGTGFHSKKDNKITSFLITQKIVNDYKGVRFNKEWNPEAINDRWQWFCEQVEEILDIELTENKREGIQNDKA